MTEMHSERQRVKEREQKFTSVCSKAESYDQCNRWDIAQSRGETWDLLTAAVSQGKGRGQVEEERVGGQREKRSSHRRKRGVRREKCERKSFLFNW